MKMTKNEALELLRSGTVLTLVQRKEIAEILESEDDSEDGWDSSWDDSSC